MSGNRKRSGSSSGSPNPDESGGGGIVSGLKANKMIMKEKIVQMYDQLLKGEEPSSKDDDERRYWSEFFLVKPKIGVLEAEIGKLSTETLMSSDSIQSNLNRLFAECIITLGDEHHIRVVYALQTLCGLIRAITKKQSTLNQGAIYDPTTLLVGYDQVEIRMQTLIGHINDFLMGDEPSSLKDLCLKLLLVMASSMDNVSQNTLIEFIMINSVFESLVHLLSHSNSRAIHGHSVVLLITILIQYRKYESANPYIVKLSILDQELSLHGYAQVITSSLVTYTQSYVSSLSDQTSSGWLSSLTSMVGNMFVSDEGSPRIEQMKARNSVLLALYEAVHLNRNFIATLAHYQTDSSSPQIVPQDSSHSNKLGPPTPVDASVPNNLLVTFLEYCSIVMQDIKTDSSHNTVKLSFLILLCITEDQFANAIMHDQNLVFRVKLYRAPMRHRKVNPATESECKSKPLACAVMDLMIEFVRSHMMKRLPLELYMNCLSIIHRLLAYQKRSRVRLNYPWKELWTSLISLLKFISTNESALIKKSMNIFSLALQVVVIFNLFVTYGDTFLPSPSSYDELYYEMVRCHQTFDAVHSMALKYSTTSGEFKETALKLTNALVNIKAIIVHFNPKIDLWLAQQQLSTPSEDQILDVVKMNYDSLTLKLQDGLDQYDGYVESPRHTEFFTNLIQNVIDDTRINVVLNDLELQAVLQEFSTIQ